MSFLTIRASFSPFPAEDPLIAQDPLSPVIQTTFYAPSFKDATAVSAYATQPVAYVRAEFDIGGLRFADFEPRPPAPEVPFCMLPHSGANVAEQSGETQTIQPPAASL